MCTQKRLEILIFSSQRDDFVHFDVQRLGRHFFNKLKIKANSDALHIQMLTEESVVVAFAATDAVALAVESYARDDNQVKITMIRFVLRLKDVEVAHGKVGVLGIFHGDDVVADHGGEYYGFFQVPFLEEGLGLHLIG